MHNKTSQSDANRWTLTAKELARRLGISKRHLDGLDKSGRLPAPIRFGRSVRWSADEIRDWLVAGAPHRDRWEVLRRGNTR